MRHWLSRTVLALVAAEASFQALQWWPPHIPEPLLLHDRLASTVVALLAAFGVDALGRVQLRSRRWMLRFGQGISRRLLQFVVLPLTGYVLFSSLLVVWEGWRVEPFADGFYETTMTSAPPLSLVPAPTDSSAPYSDDALRYWRELGPGLLEQWRVSPDSMPQEVKSGLLEEAIRKGVYHLESARERVVQSVLASARELNHHARVLNDLEWSLSRVPTFGTRPFSVRRDFNRDRSASQTALQAALHRPLKPAEVDQLQRLRDRGFSTVGEVLEASREERETLAILISLKLHQRHPTALDSASSEELLDPEWTQLVDRFSDWFRLEVRDQVPVLVDNAGQPALADPEPSGGKVRPRRGEFPPKTR